MKYYLSLIAAAALTLSACSQQAAAPAEAVASAASQVASAVSGAASEVASAVAGAASEVTAAVTPAAEGCETTVEANDQLKYNVSQIDVSKKCTQFTIHLKNVGTQPKTAMGHNVVITKADDMNAVAMEGVTLGLDKEYLNTTDPRVVAYSPMIGGGEETSVTFDTSKIANGSYAFFCTFPGHSGTMKGEISLVD
ncbi:azurin [Stenoxybacter acetivorans]|uniref:azurin n=1 Tax=Stenoxybacter acetivorans TaxID=422441 RepID=UPI000559FA5A|nr:azurin [Stenoxybacter acetivorans]